MAELVLVVAVVEGCDDLEEARGRYVPGQDGIRNAPFVLLRIDVIKMKKKADLEQSLPV